MHIIYKRYKIIRKSRRFQNRFNISVLSIVSNERIHVLKPFSTTRIIIIIIIISERYLYDVLLLNTNIQPPET